MCALKDKSSTKVTASFLLGFPRGSEALGVAADDMACDILHGFPCLTSRIQRSSVLS